MQISHVEELIGPQLDAVQTELSRILGSDHPFLQELGLRIMSNPGKRLRPKLLLMCSRMLGYDGRLASIYAAVFELVHTATLIHDDIIDEAKTRRGKVSMNQEFGKTLTVLYGDLLYTKAHTAAIEVGRIDVLHTITSVSERMIEGELLQDRHNFDLNISEEVYMDILTRKTAYLFSGTTRTAAQMLDRGDEEIEALNKFGFHLGISFQLMDDYLDYMGSEKEMGKPVLNDLRDGKVTLPLIKLLAKDESGHVRGLIENFWQDKDGAVPPELLNAIEEAGVLEETWELAKVSAEKAVSHLEVFPDNEFSMLLRALPLGLLTRKK